MSCLQNCRCSKTPKETDSSEIQVIHEESSYQPLSEASFISEAIPLLPTDSTMITYEVDIVHYTLVSVIGKGLGNSAKINVARHIPTGKHVAVRRINLDFCPEDITYIQNEILVTRQLRHENLLPYYCAFVAGDEVWTVMPLVTYGSCRVILDLHFVNGFSEIAIALILKGVLLALDYIHRRGFIHRSIKASHILISSSGRAILSGLRYSCNVIHNGKWQNSIHSFPHDCSTNLNWLSPELLEQNLTGYNSKSDIYSLGITACELANGVVPFQGLSPTQMLLEKLQGFPQRPLDSQSVLQSESALSSRQSLEHSYQSKCFSQCFHAFTEICLQRDQIKRPSALHLLSHPFIKQCKKTNVSLKEIMSEVTPIIELSMPLSENDLSVQKIHIEDLSFKEYWSF